MEDPTEIGKFGTIKLLKRREPSTVVASYPIDDEEVTFGRDRSCSVRLYYQWVSPVHCKVVFEERKAFLQIFGANGVVVDGCPVFPTNGSGIGHATVPLPNGSTFEIHKKLFMFNYPPKELRPQLFTPGTEAKRRKNLRMSMVQSAHVFSPAPSPNPRDNLRVLQSPLKISSLADDEPVTLVDGNNPVVFQEEQDLVILEDIDPENVMPLNQLPPLPQLPPQTPRRKSIPSLHRAVLIRSAQRVQYMRELQAQRQWVAPPMETHAEVINVDDDAAEEEEVEEAISDDLIIPDEEEAMDEDEDGDGEEYFEEQSDNVVHDTLDIMDDEQDITEAREEYEEEVAQPVQSSTPHVNPARPLGKFMTPQLKQSDWAIKEEEDVKLKQGPMRPPPGYRFSMGPGVTTVQNQSISEDVTFEAESVREKSRSHSPSKQRQEVSEEERKAIIERRKSNVRAPDDDFAEHAPGLRGGRTSLAPNSPSKPASPFKSIRSTIDDGEDTRSVLQRLEESLEDMRKKSKSHQSIGLGKAAGLPPSPEKSGFSLLAKGAGTNATFDKTKFLKRDLRMPSYGRDMSAIVNGGGSQAMKNESDEREGDMDVDDVSDDEKPEDGTPRNADPVASNSPSKESKAARRARRSEIVPATPRMDGLKDMFRPTKDSRGLETPYVRGMRDLFREEPSTNIANTPKLDGMRSLFNEKRVPDTPVYDGITKIMPDNLEKEDERGEEAEQEAHTDDETEAPPESESHTRLRMNPLTVARSRSRVVRGTPTDMSTMADDEMTPDVLAGPSPKKRGGKGADTVPEEGAIVHKTTRTRKPISKRVISANEEVEADIRKPTSRQPQVIENTKSNETDNLPKTKSRTRNKTHKPESSATTTNATESEDPVPSRIPSKASRRARTAAASTEAATTNTEDERPAGRMTRARSQSVEPDGEASNAEDDPLASVGSRYKRSTRGKAQNVETIPEEEEASVPEKRTKTTAALRSRKAKTQVTVSETEGTVPASTTTPASATTKRKPTSRTRTTTNDSLDTSDVPRLSAADKENTPERNPESPKSNESNTEGAAVVPTKATKARAANTRRAVTASSKAASNATTVSKLPTSKSSATRRTLKATTTDSEESAAPRATRARARK